MEPECGSEQELDLGSHGSLVHSGATESVKKVGLTWDIYMWRVPKFCHFPVPFYRPVTFLSWISSVGKDELDILGSGRVKVTSPLSLGD